MIVMRASLPTVARKEGRRALLGLCAVQEIRPM